MYYSILIPQNYIAEEILLGSIIINSNLFLLIIKNITINDFFIEAHKILYRNLLDIQKKNSINIIDLINTLKKAKLLKIIGGIQKITLLIKQGQLFTNSKNINFYIKQIIRILHENYTRRLLIQYGNNIIKLAYHREINNYTLYNKAKQYLYFIDQKINSKNLDNLQDLIGLLLKNIHISNNNTINSNNHIYSGFQDLDILTNGLPYGDLIVIAGRPSTGKTSLVIHMAYNLLIYFNINVCIFSLEMSIAQILYKLISIGSKISITNILSGKLNKNQWDDLQKTCNKLLKASIYINDNSNITIQQIKYIINIIIRATDKQHIIIIDYLQLIEAKELNVENRNYELGYITRQLKILAQVLNKPIIILSQLNRNIENRLNKEPLLSDLKESGCINYKLFINIDKSNMLNIRNIINQNKYIQILYYEGLRNNLEKYKNINNYDIHLIQLLRKYNFKCRTNKKIYLMITNYHKILQNKVWTEQQEFNKNQKIIQDNYFQQIYQRIIMQIEFINYDLVYDITKNNYTNFTCNHIIVHNSIEQDADIIIMLSNNISIEKNIINKKIINIFISKNRNGPKGSFKLYFNAEKNFFSRK